MEDKIDMWALNHVLLGYVIVFGFYLTINDWFKFEPGKIPKPKLFWTETRTTIK